MFDIGFMELLVVGVLGLLVLGPERLPVAARSAGLFLGKIRRTLNHVQDELERQVRAEELREKLKDPYATFLDDEDEPTIRPHQSAVSGSQVPQSPTDTTPIEQVEARQSVSTTATTPASLDDAPRTSEQETSTKP